MILFNDRDIDNWFNGSTASGVNTARMHSFSDGIVLIGPRSLPNIIPSFDSDGMAFRTKTGTTKIKILEDGSKIIITVGPFMTMEIDATGQWKLLNAAGQDLITTLMNLFTQSTVLGVQIVPSPADFLVLTSFKP
jgi:hypothetical protein